MKKTVGSALIVAHRVVIVFLTCCTGCLAFRTTHRSDWFACQRTVTDNFPLGCCWDRLFSGGSGLAPHFGSIANTLHSGFVVARGQFSGQVRASVFRARSMWPLPLVLAHLVEGQLTVGLLRPQLGLSAFGSPRLCLSRSSSSDALLAPRRSSKCERWIRTWTFRWPQERNGCFLLTVIFAWRRFGTLKSPAENCACGI